MGTNKKDKKRETGTQVSNSKRIKVRKRNNKNLRKNIKNSRGKKKSNPVHWQKQSWLAMLVAAEKSTEKQNVNWATDDRDKCFKNNEQLHL